MEHVQNYITAYYLGEEELEAWLREKSKVCRHVSNETFNVGGRPIVTARSILLHQKV